MTATAGGSIGGMKRGLQLGASRPRANEMLEAIRADEGIPAAEFDSLANSVAAVAISPTGQSKQPELAAATSQIF